MEKSHSIERRKGITGSDYGGKKDISAKMQGLSDYHGGSGALCRCRQPVFGSQFPGAGRSYRYCYYHEPDDGAGDRYLDVCHQFADSGAWNVEIRMALYSLYTLLYIGHVLYDQYAGSHRGPDQGSVAGSAGGRLFDGGESGTVFKAGATSGGTDIIIKLLRLRLPHLKTGLLFLLTDAVIVTASAFVFQDIDTALYAGLVVFVNSILLDMVLYGRDGAKMFFIISDCHEAIVRRLLEELDISATYISGQGAYTKADKNVILCVVKKHLSPKLEEIVKQEDPKAFTIITSATEIYGEGYKNIFSQKL